MCTHSIISSPRHQSASLSIMGSLCWWEEGKRAKGWGKRGTDVGLKMWKGRRCKAAIMVMDEGVDAGWWLCPKEENVYRDCSCAHERVESATCVKEIILLCTRTPDATRALLSAVISSDESVKVREKQCRHGVSPKMEGQSNADAVLLGNTAAAGEPQHSWIILLPQGEYQSCGGAKGECRSTQTQE